jgi:hypothetical protein
VLRRYAELVDPDRTMRPAERRHAAEELRHDVARDLAWRSGRVLADRHELRARTAQLVQAYDVDRDREALLVGLDDVVEERLRVEHDATHLARDVVSWLA